MTGAAANRGPIVIERDVLPTEEFKRWLRDNNGPNALNEWEAWEPHVTVLYSGTFGLDWPVLQDDELSVEADGYFVALRGGQLGIPVKSTVLAHRHFSLREAGWQFDFPGYTPHVTLWQTFPGPRGRERMPPKPYEGLLRLGAERAKTPRRFRKEQARVDSAPF